MKSLLVAASVLLSFSFAKAEFIAESCNAQVHSIAQMNMNQKAKAYGFELADLESVEKVKFESTINTKNESLIKYSVGAYIYKGTYNVEIVVDSSCAVHSVNITEVL